MIFLVDVSNGPSFALRVEPRWKRYRDFRRRRRATQFWNRHTLPTPRILYPARRKRSGFAHYPLALLIRLLSLFASKRDRDAFCTEQSNGRAILLGSNHLFIRARKA